MKQPCIHLCECHNNVTQFSYSDRVLPSQARKNFKFVMSTPT